MNTVLSTWMKLALTATVIMILVFGLMFATLKNEANQYKSHLKDNMNDVIKSQLDAGTP